MRICSLLPGATESVYALGAGDDLVAVSHECDFPPQARTKPVVLHSRLNASGSGSLAIDTAVRETLSAGGSLYSLDIDALIAARPDVIITQDLCRVCAIDTPSVEKAATQLDPPPQIVSWHAHTLTGVREDIRRLAAAIGRTQEGARLEADWRRRVDQLRERCFHSSTQRARVACIEWFDPLMSAGHWVPEMVALAGGEEVLAQPGEPSVRISLDQLLALDPDVLILMPCGFPIDHANEELPLLAGQPWWAKLRAVQNGRAHIVDGPAYFNRPGPRLIDGIELLAGLLRP